MLTHIIYYDELIERPVEHLQDIARFLGIHDDFVDEAAEVCCEPQCQRGNSCSVAISVCINSLTFAFGTQSSLNAQYAHKVTTPSTPRVSKEMKARAVKKHAFADDISEEARAFGWKLMQKTMPTDVLAHFAP